MCPYVVMIIFTRVTHPYLMTGKYGRGSCVVNAIGMFKRVTNIIYGNYENALLRD